VFSEVNTELVIQNFRVVGVVEMRFCAKGKIEGLIFNFNNSFNKQQFSAIISTHMLA